MMGNTRQMKQRGQDARKSPEDVQTPKKLNQKIGQDFAF